MLKDRIKSLRTRKKLTQSEMAKRIGVARTTYAMYEQGHREPDYETLEKIADYFEVSVDYLLGRDSKVNDEQAFEKWMNDPTVYKFYKEFSDSPEERREALLAVWEILKSKK